MAYSTFAQVSSEFKSITFSATTEVTSTEITRFIEEADAEIDSFVGRKYVVPITQSESLKIMRMLSIWLVADRVREIMQMKDVGIEKLKQGVRAPNSAKRARDMLDKIVDGEIKLSDASLSTTHDGVQSFAVEESLEHTFKKGVDQW